MRRVGDFAAVMGRRVEHAREAIRVADESGDEYGLAVHLAELEDLLRVARQHGLTVRLPAGSDLGGSGAGDHTDGAEW